MIAAEKQSHEIPRRRNSNGSEGGPYILPPGAVHQSGRKKCETCGRMVKTDHKRPRKGSCQCFYAKRTTTFIDVIQDEYLLKQWGNRNVAWGMGQRPDLVLAATACKPDSDNDQPPEDKTELNRIAAEAQSVAGNKIKASIGTSLHKLTHKMDRGEDLGFVPDRWVNDLKAYEDCMKREGIEHVSVESFRVFDGWMEDVSECDHKPRRYGGSCTCMAVAGTIDRLSWVRGRLRALDVKTGSDFNKLGFAMQLAMYAHMVPYQYPGDVRGVDPGEVDLNVGYIIKLPEGKGHCEIEPVDLRIGWEACQVAKMVWDLRERKDVVLERDIWGDITEMAMRAGSVKECQRLWQTWKADGLLDNPAKAALISRAAELKAKAGDRSA